MRANRIVSGFLALLASLHAAPSMAVSFIDGTFTLADYSITTYQSGGATIENEQIQTGGDPGAAAETIITVPSTSEFQSGSYWLNKSFTYVPTTQGVIESIDVSANRYFKTTFNLISEGINFVIAQGGDLYVHDVSLAPANGDWETAAKSGLLAADFDLVTDLATGATDSSKHPNFAGGELEFGFRAGVNIESDTAASVTTVKTDNLSFVIHAQGLPSISSLQPSGVDAGSAAFTLIVNGANFTSGDTVEWNGISLVTTYVSASQLTAKVSAADVAAAGSVAVTVVNTSAGDQTSTPAMFSIPLTSMVIESQSIATSSAGFSITLTVRNAGFNAATDVLLTGAYLGTAPASTVLPIDIASIAPQATKIVTLKFPATAGKTGAERFFVLDGSFAGGGISLSSLETLP